MSVTILKEKVSQLPAEKQKEVKDFVDSLLAQVKIKGEEKSEIKKPMFGALKGTIIMADGFDEPLEDFKDYI
jgi:hypothetical protein